MIGTPPASRANIRPENATGEGTLDRRADVSPSAASPIPADGRASVAEPNASRLALLHVSREPDGAVNQGQPSNCTRLERLVMQCLANVAQGPPADDGSGGGGPGQLRGGPWTNADASRWWSETGPRLAVAGVPAGPERRFRPAKAFSSGVRGQSGWPRPARLRSAPTFQPREP